MIRFKWRNYLSALSWAAEDARQSTSTCFLRKQPVHELSRHASAPLSQRRWSSSSSSSSTTPPRGVNLEHHPAKLTRRTHVGATNGNNPRTDDALEPHSAGHQRTRRPWQKSSSASTTPYYRPSRPRDTSESRLTLVIGGLSTNLLASDFYRLAPTTLSSWHDTIKNVQQVRDPHTFEPSGRYHVTFGSAEAAIAYRDKLIRLHRLHRFKLQNSNGLWESSVPSFLRSAEADVSVQEEVDSFTIAPGSLQPFNVDRKRVLEDGGNGDDGAPSWMERLERLIESDGHGVRPSVLMMRIYPPTLTADELASFIRSDGYERGCKWQVSKPHYLKDSIILPDDETGRRRRQQQQQQSTDRNERGISPVVEEALKGRFVVSCSHITEAKRFQRHWNQRILDRGPKKGGEQNMVHTSLISW